MSWLLAIAGIALLVILHEFGHFVTAKAVGMRVERFALFFPPMLLTARRGETEYGIGAIPLGGFVKITGMNPNETIPPEALHRAYYRQPVWKRLVVISAGPVMNVLIAFLVFWALFLANGFANTNRIDRVERGHPASGVLRAGDRVLAVDGRNGGPERYAKQIGTHRCARQPPTDGCLGVTPAHVRIRRDGRVLDIVLRPRYDPRVHRMRLGFGYGEGAGPGTAARLSVEEMWRVTSATVSGVARIFDPERRKELSGVVGATDVTQQSFRFSISQALLVLAIISLSLAVINLFPFLPLDGGHIFWALAEKVRGRSIPFSVMERAGVIGFVLVIFVFLVGLSNDIDRLRGHGFNVR